MRVTSIRLQNFRSFVDSGVIAFDQINVLIGANNAGKSTILRGLQLLQQGMPEPYPDVRVGVTEAHIEIGLIEGQDVPQWNTRGSSGGFAFAAKLTSSDRRGGNHIYTLNVNNQVTQGVARLTTREPHHFIIPFLSKRKATGYQEDIREELVVSVAGDVSSLAAKLSRLGNPAYPFHEAYVSACKSILGFVVTAIPSQGGQRPGVYLANGETIPIDQLGEGVPNIVHLLVNLAVSRKKLFLIEEPENDLHPQALKSLLELIVESSSQNQFVVSTHSNIVVRHLCATPNSLLYQIRPKDNSLPVESEIAQVPDSPGARLSVLSDLGYSLSDLELWDGWLVLEESSAERIVRDYLIPWFAPTLSRLRTLAAGGTSKVAAMFEELHRLFVFTHLTPIYRERSWVVVDGDDTGREVVARLKEKFPQEYHSRFLNLSSHSFEGYYPVEFRDKADAALAHKDEAQRRRAKKELLQEVMLWLDEDRDRGVQALASSASEVIRILRDIASALPGAP